MKFIVLALCMFAAAMADNTCPPCIWDMSETVNQYCSRMLSEGGPSDGVCDAPNSHIWYHYGPDFNFTQSTCCCLDLVPSTELNCTDAAAPTCPPVPLFKKSDKIFDYFARVVATVGKGAPTNGCCAPGSFKYIFPAAYIGQEEDLCGCFGDHQRVDPNP